MLEFLRSRHRKELLSTPFPDSWMPHLTSNVHLYGHLEPDQQAELQNDLRILIDEKSWEGCGGLTMTDEVKVTIAAHACLLTLNLDHDYYPNLESILVYPTGYTARSRSYQPGGVVQDSPSSRLGEAWSTGPIVLSWEDVLQDGRGEHPGHNVTLHEFAHKLDMASGGADGVPALHADADYARWAEVMSDQYAHLLHRLQHGEHPIIDPYGATNPAEFFAVSTEMFFEHPLVMQSHLEPMYGVLKSFYRQDPAASRPTL